MKTIEVSKQMKSYLTSTKVFVSKSQTRPVLTCALVNEKHIIATDSHRLIRITHNEEIQEPFLHEYEKMDDVLDVDRYPNTERLIPNPSDAQHSFTIDVKEWLEAHEGGLIAAKEHDKNDPITLEDYRLHVKPVLEKQGKWNKKERAYEKIEVPLHDQITYNYVLDVPTGIEKITYNCKYMIEALKVFKKFKHKEVTFHFYGIHRPFLLVAGDIEVLILPIRIN